MHRRFTAGWHLILLALLVGISLVSRAEATEGTVTGDTATVAWFLNWEPQIAGYRVHYGPGSRDYDKTVDAGNHLSAELNDLTPGETYYCAITAYNTIGLESDYSDEISFTAAAPLEEADSDGDGLSDLFENTFGDGLVLQPFEDPDRDGLVNLVEFVHGLDPNTAQPGTAVKFEMTRVDDGSYLTVRYLLDPLALNFVTLHLERSVDLADPGWWEALSTVQISSEPSVDNPGVLEVVVRSLDPIGGLPKEFFRMGYTSLSTQ